MTGRSDLECNGDAGNHCEDAGDAGAQEVTPLRSERGCTAAPLNVTKQNHQGTRYALDRRQEIILLEDGHHSEDEGCGPEVPKPPIGDVAVRPVEEHMAPILLHSRSLTSVHPRRALSLPP